MKMKKLLAGVLSAAMVATMIPASMALGVSAADVPEAVKSYDFTTDAYAAEWSSTGGAYWMNGTGIHFKNGYSTAKQSYTVANPLQGQAANGFSVAVTVTIPSGDYVNAYESMFNFNGTAAQTDAVYSVSGNGGGTHYNDWDGNYWDITTGAAVDLSQGSIFVLTVDSEDNITMYSNGEEVNAFTSANISATGSTIPVAELVDSMNNFSLGAAPNVWGQPAMDISAVSFYGSALTAEQVTALGAYEAPEEPEPEEPTEFDIGAGLIGAYTFDNDSLDNIASEEENASAVVVDKGNGLTETEESATFVEGHNGGKAVSFDGSTDGNALKLDATFSGNAQTISFWMNTTAYNNWTSAFFANNSGNGNYVNIMPQGWDDSTLNPQYVEGSASGGFGLIGGAQGGQVVDQWYMVTFVVDGTTLTIYRNGQAVQAFQDGVFAPTATVTEGRLATMTELYLGANVFADPLYNGAVDDVYLYNRALTAADVAALYAASGTDVEQAYAKSIADDLNITMRGRQAGTINEETAVRFVANLDQDAINGNEAVTKLGWAAEDGTAVTEHAKGYTLTTVTTDSNLAATGKYAYTYVQQTSHSVAVLPCVQITVNGNDYWFAYDGFSGSAVSTEKSAVVSAIDVEGVFAAAAENTLA